MSQNSEKRVLLVDGVDNIGYRARRARYGIIKSHMILSF